MRSKRPCFFLRQHVCLATRQTGSVVSLTRALTQKEAIDVLHRCKDILWAKRPKGWPQLPKFTAVTDAVTPSLLVCGGTTTEPDNSATAEPGEASTVTRATRYPEGLYLLIHRKSIMGRAQENTTCILIPNTFQTSTGRIG